MNLNPWTTQRREDPPEEEVTTETQETETPPPPSLSLDDVRSVISESLNEFRSSLPDAVKTAMQQTRPEVQEPDPDPEDPYSQIQAKLWERPGDALKELSALHAKQTADAVKKGQEELLERLTPVLASMQPIVRNTVMTAIDDGLDDEAKSVARDFIKEAGFTDEQLAVPTVQKVVRNAALVNMQQRQIESMKKSVPITTMESATPFGDMDIPSDEREELAGLKKVADAMGLKFDAQKALAKVRER